MSERFKEFKSRVGSEVIDLPDMPKITRERPIGVASSTKYRDVKNSGAGRWGINGDDYYGVTASSSKLEPGLYVCRWADGIGPYLAKQPINVDDLIRLPDNASEEVIQEVVHFSTLADRFKEFGFLYKRGIMLWGPPGSGKTSTIQQLIELFVNNLDGVAIQIQSPELAADCIRLIRKIEPERQILAIMEDLDALVRENGENAYLSLLDGENQTKNVVFVATTNYPERLDRRFVDRPSRFDTIKFVGMPVASARRCYFENKMPKLSADQISEYVKNTEGYSVAHMKELIVLTQCFGVGLTDAVAKLDQMIDRQPTSDKLPDSNRVFGFTPEKSKKNS
jgi:GTPase SAR1 family protein